MRTSEVYAVLNQEFLSAESGQHTPVMLWGPPGIGKSQLVAQVAAQHDVTMIDIRLSQMEPTDLRGIPFRSENRVEWAIPAMLPDATRHGARGILFLDEITSAPPSVSAAAYQLILDRSLGEYAIPEGWAIFAAGNRQGDRGVTYTMPAPLANRFSHYEVEPHLDDWVAWAFAHNVDERLIGFLRFRPELLFEFDAQRNPIAFPSPRSWEFAGRALRKFDGRPRLMLGGLQACVGAAPGLELHAYVESVTRMPDVHAIARGECQDVPEELDLQYAVASALVAQAIRVKKKPEENSTLDFILAYAALFPQREMGVMLVSDLHRAMGAGVTQAANFKPWARQVLDLMFDHA